MEELYYNYWNNELPALIQSATNDSRNLIPLTEDKRAVINQEGNNHFFGLKMYASFLAGGTGLDLWKSSLQPMLVDYISRCRDNAPNNAIGQYMVNCHKRWCDNTIEILTKTKELVREYYYAKDYYKKGDYFYKSYYATEEIEQLIENCSIAQTLYEADTICKINAPLVELSAARPAPDQTAQYANKKDRADVLKILQFEGLQKGFDTLFEKQVFANNNGVWEFDTRRNKVWELALFIMLVDNVVNNNKGLVVCENPSGYNWRLFERWIRYSGQPLKSSAIKQRASAVLNKDNDDINKSPVFLALLDSYKEQ